MFFSNEENITSAQDGITATQPQSTLNDITAANLKPDNMMSSIVISSGFAPQSSNAHGTLNASTELLKFN